MPYGNSKQDYITAMHSPDATYDELETLVEQAAYDPAISRKEYEEIYNEALAVYRSWRGF